MAVNSVSSNYQAARTSSASQTAGASVPGVDGSAFMEVLLAQLRHQNPLEPMDDKELIGQMAQLNSLQELQKINTTLGTLVGITLPGEAQES
jgi:flagellar basal-body rod modification protein FlgD